MASTDLRAELECSVCLSVYTDPVSLKCGHNFCRACIDHVLNGQKSAIFSCPECRAEFPERPALHRNITLRNIVENFQSAHLKPEEPEIFCTYCIDTPVPAVRSCLHCDASMCDNHLRVHSKSPEHVLCDPTTSLESRTCSVHKELLKYYCTEDFTCICVSCSLVGDHWGHQVETLDEASEMKKETLRNILQKVTTKREAMEKRVQNLHEHRKRVHGRANNEKDRISTLIRNLRRQLKVLEKKVLNEICSQTERVSQSLLKLIRQLDVQKDELSRTMCHIQKLCNTTDPVTVLQEPETDLYDMEDGDDRLLHGGGDLDMAAISHTLHSGIAEVLSGVNVQKGPATRVDHRPNTKDKGHINAKPPKTQPAQPAPAIKHSYRQARVPNIRAVQPKAAVFKLTDISLDESTAGNRLCISEDGKTASWSDQTLHRPETPQRFQVYPQVLSTHSFSSGRHYWEVDVGGSGDWIVGVCYPSIDKRGGQSLIGGSNKSWGLERWGWDKQYLVIHDREKIQLPGEICIKRVRIELDYEAGRISFNDLCEPMQHLHTFTTTFTEPLHASFYVGDGSITICEGSQM